MPLNADRLENLFKSFSQATGMTTAIVSLDGKILIESGWQRICSDFHRRNPASEKRCVHSDTMIHKDLLNGSGQLIYRCPHGLVDAATPIIVNHTHVANLFTGQFLFEPPDADTIDAFRRQASQWGFDEAAYIEALLDVPVISENRLKPMLQFLKDFSEMIGELGSSHLELKEKEDSLVKAHTALKKEKRQHESEAKKLTEILEGSPVPTFVVDSDSRLTHWNRACEMLTDIPAADIIGTDNHREAFHSGRRKVMADFMVNETTADELSKVYGDKCRRSRLIKDGYEGEDFFPRLGKKGKWLFFTAAPLKDANGHVLGAIETIQDFTDRRLAEQKLRASESRYRRLFESANDAIFILKEGRIVDCNQKTLEIFDCTREVMIGRSPLEISPTHQPGGASSRDEIDQKRGSVTQDIPQFFEWRYLRHDGTTFDAEVSLVRYAVDDSHFELAIVRDVSDQKEMIKILQDRETELDEKSSYLEKVNQALKASLDHREIEKRAVEENMLVNLKRFVFPYIEELGKCNISTDAKAYLSIIDTNLNDIVSHLSKTIFSKYIDLTPTEVRVADFIREDKNTKEVAGLLGLSQSSVQWHRKNLREKLGLTNKKVNLHTYLNSLSG